ncbi:MAG TPA: DEAD/DEAH box helicase, partial [Blastocatellia bacterium]|nr:DEAD/DEAH box helicase [Blastocatellia bacterium]
MESIREFDPETQRSVNRVSETIIVAMRELSVRREEFMQWADAAEQRWTEERFRRDLRARLAHAERGEPFPGWEYLIPLTRPLNSSAFDYFKDAVLVIDEPVEVETRAGELYGRLADRFAQAEEGGELALPPDELFLTADELRAKLDASTRVELRLLGREAARTDERFRIDSLTLGESAAGDPSRRIDPGAVSDSDVRAAAAAEKLDESFAASRRRSSLFLFNLTESTPDVPITSQAPRRYHGRVPDLAREIEADSRTTLFVMPSLGLAERVVEMLAEYNVTAELMPSLSSRPRPAAARVDRRIVTVGKVSNGFSLPAADLNLLTESDVFGEADMSARQRALPRRVRKQRKAAAFLSDLGDLKVGDYVVHVDHGIGQFQGLTQITTAGAATGNVAVGLERARSDVREFMLLTYAEGARLYVPVERLDLVQRYSGSEGTQPTLDRLGGIGWQKAKARAKRAMRDMAEELLKLYAERKLVQGHAYGTDTPWQQEFEDAFEYQLTPDQEAAIEDVKAGMESMQPMDRLIVGDVGYGKTEVAMRAAFKAVMEGKQVAVLAPTTVLVFQHLKTFQQRFSAFPARIEMLSRFRTTKDQREVVKMLEAGSVDVVIGTHRLLSKDIRFKDLGLLVVDEEQRFGVAHKERIKQMRKKVDVIAMSATPIPRTLNMSLAGLRDMSIIETPPRDRLAIQTHVVQFSEAVVRSAIELELQRSGQAFFVHNRVETIFTIAELIQRLVPGARLGVGHGQMGEKDLEEVIMKFVRHELDVLVCTTIIENGIDIPLANTIIINRADKYGLSQLYQLRGRVGRSSRRAYAYLLIPGEDTLSDIARRRLAAIREFSDL